MRRWYGLTEKYVKDCEVRGLAPSTLKLKYREVTRFGNWLHRRKPRPRIEEITAAQVVEYIKYSLVAFT